jgi:hypothetical protein
MLNLTAQWQVNPVLMPSTFSRNSCVNWKYKNRLFSLGGF